MGEGIARVTASCPQILTVEKKTGAGNILNQEALHSFGT